MRLKTTGDEIDDVWLHAYDQCVPYCLLVIIYWALSLNHLKTLVLVLLSYQIRRETISPSIHQPIIA